MKNYLSNIIKRSVNPLTILTILYYSRDSKQTNPFKELSYGENSSFINPHPRKPI
jgi:hypothetical protein